MRLPNFIVGQPYNTVNQVKLNKWYVISQISEASRILEVDEILKADSKNEVNFTD